MQQLEERARELWANPVTIQEDGRFVAHPLKELVAMGVVNPDDQSVMWYELENVAEENPDGRGEFYVDGMAIFDVLKSAAEDFGYLRIGADTRRCVDAMLREQVIVIWHTHTATTDPSREDIAEFPTWLADYGMVYHVPTGATTVYNQSGVISSPRAEVEPSIATSKE